MRFIKIQRKGKKGGAQPGAGRPPGSKNKSSQQWREEILASGQSPLHYLMGVMWDEKSEASRRDKAAEKCLPFFHAHLQAYVRADTGEDIIPDLSGVSEATLQAIADLRKLIPATGA